jgi:hypothetical protein
MRLRTVAVLGLVAAATAAAVVRRRRRSGPPAPPAQLGRRDGAVQHLAADNRDLPALRARAEDLRAALETVL